MVKTLYFDKIIIDEDMKQHHGSYFDEDHYNIIVDEDCDGYTSDGKLLFKLRKRVIDDHLCYLALQCFEKSAKSLHENRGAAAGELDRNKLRDYVGEFVNPNKFRTKYKSSKTGIEINRIIANVAPSNIGGYYDKPNRNIPNGPRCRLTSFTRDNFEKWTEAIPYIQKVDQMFKELIPERHKKQLERARKTPNYVIADTCFSTVTMNYSWRTACHKDAGDYKDGFGNILVCENEDNPFKYRGCYLGFPQFGVCLNVRQGDFCATNVHEWHCNTEFIPDFDTEPDFLKLLNKKPNKDEIIRHNNKWYFNRLSMVFYLRDQMIRCSNEENK